MNSDVLSRNEIYSSLEGEVPYAAYIKTILGQVAVSVWDSISDKPSEAILHGNPKSKDGDCIVKVWNVKEDNFFKRVNQRHFKKGILVPFKVEEIKPEPKTVEQATDDELKKIINYKFLALTAELNKIDSVAVLFRMKNLAEEMEKSEKIAKAIEARISEVQDKEYTRPANPGEAEE